MVQILIVTHGPLADALKESALLVYGKTEQLRTIGLFHGDNIDDLYDKIVTNIKEINEEDGVLVFVDMFGGTPCNKVALAIKNLKEYCRIECIVGVNLPILIEALCLRSDKTKTLDEMVKELLQLALKTSFSLRERLEI